MPKEPKSLVEQFPEVPKGNAWNARTWESARRMLGTVVPQTWGEALHRYPQLQGLCPGYEWDNRTTVENAVWLIQQLIPSKLHAEFNHSFRGEGADCEVCGEGRCYYLHERGRKT